jgi:hypothetical protein
VPEVVNVRRNKIGSNAYSFVGRPTALGNPYAITAVQSRESVLIQHAEWVFDHPELWEKILALQGRDLGCFCAPERCHADLYLWMANTPEIRQLVASILKGKKQVSALKRAWNEYKVTLKAPQTA